MSHAVAEGPARQAPKPFVYQDPFPLSADSTVYRRLEGSERYVHVDRFGDADVLRVEPEALEVLTREAMRDVSFMLRPSHNAQVAAILDDPESSANDRGVALAFLRNAVVAAEGELPVCQDTGTATVVAKKGQRVWTGVKDEEWISRGVYRTYTEENLRYSQTVPLDTYTETNTGTNLPAQIDIAATTGDEYRFLFMAKGGGSANKTMLYQQTKALLTPDRLESFLVEKMKSLGTAACPPYHIAFVIGGTSADAVMKAVKLASAHELDGLPTTGNEHGRAFRDVDLEERLLEAARSLGIGAQFGGRHFAHDVRVIRLPRHGASCPVGMAVSCSADRNIRAKITRDGLFVEALDRDPARRIPERYRGGRPDHGHVIDLDRGMDAAREALSALEVGDALRLTGTLVVARDIAHARFKEILDRGDPLPEYLREHPVYYAGPAKKPDGRPSGSFGPTTANRMDAYVDLLQSHGGSLIMIAKGNRSPEVVEACRKHGGFYLGSPGGPAAILAADHIRHVECIAFPELGMEAVWKIRVEEFPAFILIDDKGNDFFAGLGL
ncbi:MAG: fumarate hydratase [Gemmatimonadota bacterium]|jgi:fumarate hydratase class I